MAADGRKRFAAKRPRGYRRKRTDLPAYLSTYPGRYLRRVKLWQERVKGGRNRHSKLLIVNSVCILILTTPASPLVESGHVPRTAMLDSANALHLFSHTSPTTSAVAGAATAPLARRWLAVVGCVSQILLLSHTGDLRLQNLCGETLPLVSLAWHVSLRRLVPAVVSSFPRFLWPPSARVTLPPLSPVPTSKSVGP